MLKIFTGSMDAATSPAFVIEFENAEALKAYAKHPKKKAWDDFYYNIRETSYNCVTTN